MSWLKRLFRRPDPPPRFDLRPKPKPCDDWRAGDLGTCVVKPGGFWCVMAGPMAGHMMPGPKRGETVRVSAVLRYDGTLHLMLVGYPGDSTFAAYQFRKIDEKGEGELVERIKKLHVPARRKKELTDA